MAIDFSSVHNHTEAAVFERVQAIGANYPGLADRPELMVDVACVALNRLQPRYIRHSVDMAFYLSDKERSQTERAVADAVESAFEVTTTNESLLAPDAPPDLAGTYRDHPHEGCSRANPREPPTRANPPPRCSETPAPGPERVADAGVRDGPRSPPEPRRRAQDH